MKASGIRLVPIYPALNHTTTPNKDRADFGDFPRNVSHTVVSTPEIFFLIAMVCVS